MTPAELAGYLDREAAYYQALAARYRDLAAASQRPPPGRADRPQSTTR